MTEPISERPPAPADPQVPASLPQLEATGTLRPAGGTPPRAASEERSGPLPAAPKMNFCWKPSRRDLLWAAGGASVEQNRTFQRTPRKVQAASFLAEGTLHTD